MTEERIQPAAPAAPAPTIPRRAASQSFQLKQVVRAQPPPLHTHTSSHLAAPSCRATYSSPFSQANAPPPFPPPQAAPCQLPKLSAKRKKREMQQDDDPSYKSLTAAYYDNIYYCGDFDELSSPEFPFEAKKPVPMAHANAAWRKTLKAKDDM